MPAPVEARLREATAQALADPGFAARLEAVSARPMPLAGEALQAFLARENARWEPIIRSSKVQLD